MTTNDRKGNKKRIWKEIEKKNKKGKRKRKRKVFYSTQS